MFKIVVHVDNVVLNFTLGYGLAGHLEEVLDSHVVVDVVLEEEWLRVDCAHYHALKLSDSHIISDGHLSPKWLIWLKFFSISSRIAISMDFNLLHVSIISAPRGNQPE